MLLVMVRLASAGDLSPEWAWAVPLAPSALLLSAVPLLAFREHRRVAEGRRSATRRGETRESMDRLVPGWYGRLAELVEGEQPGPGPGGWAVLARVAGRVAAVLVVGGAVLSLPIIAVTTSGGAILQIRIPSFGNTEERVRETAYGRAYRLPVDPAVSPSEGGLLLARLAPPRVSPGTPIAEFVHVPPDTVASPAYPAQCDAAFGGYITDGLDDAFERAHAGTMTPAQVDCLRGIDAMPGFALLAALARAPEADYWGAVLTIPLPPHVTPYTLPVPRDRVLRELAYAGALKAAWASGQGRAADAEQTLREILSVGYLLVDDGEFLLTPLVGTVVAGIALRSLEDHYRLSGMAEAARQLATRRDSAGVVTETLALQTERVSQWGSADPGTLRDVTIATVGDSTVLPGMRWEMLGVMSELPCTNVRELLFGPAPDLRQAWERAEAELARTATDTALVGLFREHLERLARLTPTEPANRAVHWAGGLLGSDRLKGCAIIMQL